MLCPSWYFSVYEYIFFLYTQNKVLDMCLKTGNLFLQIDTTKKFCYAIKFFGQTRFMCSVLYAAFPYVHFWRVSDTNSLNRNLIIQEKIISISQYYVASRTNAHQRAKAESTNKDPYSSLDFQNFRRRANA